MTLTATPVIDHVDVEVMRLIRNRTRGTYSSFNDEITANQQQTWWYRNRDRLKAWTYTLPHQPDAIVGFGLIRLMEDGYWHTTVAVLPEHAGCGYGREITHHLVTQAPGPCRGSARWDNPAAVRLHGPQDWEPITGPDPEIAYFETHGPLEIVWRGTEITTGVRKRWSEPT